MTMICSKSWYLVLKHSTLEGEREAKGPLGGCRVEPMFPIQQRQVLRYNPQNKISYLHSIAVR